MDARLEVLFKHYAAWKQLGVLPESGTLAEQDNILVEAFQVIDAAVSWDQDLNQKDAEGKAKKKQRELERLHGRSRAKTIHNRLQNSKYGKPRSKKDR